jgi:hypothetical protein
MQIISDPAGPGIKSTTLVYTSQDEEGSRYEKKKACEDTFSKMQNLKVRSGRIWRGTYIQYRGEHPRDEGPLTSKSGVDRKESR